MITQLATILFGLGGGLAFASLRADLRYLPDVMRQLRADMDAVNALR